MIQTEVAEISGDSYLSSTAWGSHTHTFNLKLYLIHVLHKQTTTSTKHYCSFQDDKVTEQNDYHALYSSCLHAVSSLIPINFL